MKAESNLKPKNSFEIENIIDGKCEIVFYDNIVEVEEEIEGEKIKKFIFDIYRLKTTYRNDLEIDLFNDNDKLVAWRQKAVEIENNELASDIRKERDKLLAETDKEMAFDRLGFEIPEEITATTILTVIKNLFKTISTICNGEMAKYRQALRDIPQQEGFPHNVVFPTKPNSKEREE